MKTLTEFLTEATERVKIKRSKYHRSVAEYAHFGTDSRDMKTESVPIDKLRATQSTVTKGSKGFSGSDPIDGVKTPDGLLHVTDGHHRIQHAIRSGKTHVRARYSEHDLSKINPDEVEDFENETRGMW